MRGEEAVGTPKEGEVEKIGEDGGYVESEGFERRAYFVGMPAGSATKTRTFLPGAVKAVPYKRKSPPPGFFLTL